MIFLWPHSCKRNVHDSGMSHNRVVTLPPYHEHKKREITNPTDIEALNNLDDFSCLCR